MSPKFEVYHILFEGPQNGSNKVTKDDVDRWTQQFNQNYPVVMGDGKFQNPIFNAWAQGGVIGLPLNLVIDRETMQVKAHVGPDYNGAVAACDAM